MRKKVATWQHPAPVDARVIEGPSKTIPGQVLTMDEMVKRYVRGDRNVTQFNPQYSDEDLPDFERMDEMEKLDMARALKDRNISDLSVMKKNEEARRRQKEIDKAVNEEKERKALTDTTNLLKDDIDTQKGR